MRQQDMRQQGNQGEYVDPSKDARPRTRTRAKTIKNNSKNNSKLQQLLHVQETGQFVMCMIDDEDPRDPAVLHTRDSLLARDTKSADPMPAVT